MKGTMLACPYCKATSEIKQLGDGQCECNFCGTTFYTETAERAYEEVNKAFDAHRLRSFQNAYSALNDALKPRYPNSATVIARAQEVINHDSEHFFAHLYNTVFSQSSVYELKVFFKRASKDNITIDSRITTAEFFIKYFKLSYYDEIKSYIQNAIIPLDEERGGKALQALEKRFCDESEGVYNCGLKRDVFISYKAEEQDIALAVVKELEADHKCWISCRNLANVAGTEYYPSIYSAIDNCKIVLFIFSQYTLRSDDILNEIKYATKKGKTILVYRIDNAVYNRTLKEYLGGEKARSWIDACSEPLSSESLEILGDVVYDELKAIKDKPVEQDYALQLEQQKLRQEQNAKLAEQLKLQAEQVRLQAEQKDNEVARLKAELERIKAEHNKNLKKNENLEQKNSSVHNQSDTALEDKKETETEIQEYTKAAEQGNAQAQYNLALCYKNGIGVEQDEKKAVEWYTKAAEQGHADAQYNLGGCYYYGTGVEEDEEEAVKWYKKAAEQGLADAQNNLGNCYQHGIGVEQDKDKAVEWYTKSAEQGFAYAQYNLGVCYDNGTGVEQDEEKAVEWYTKAAKQGHASATSELPRKVRKELGL